jgi:predicted alpha/beta hydrolase
MRRRYERTALAHAKSGDAAMISGYAGKSEALDDALTGFAFAYTDQTERDHAALEKAARARRIQVARSS